MRIESIFIWRHTAMKTSCSLHGSISDKRNISYLELSVEAHGRIRGGGVFEIQRLWSLPTVQNQDFSTSMKSDSYVPMLTA